MEKSLPTKYKIIISSTLLLSLLVGFNQCVMKASTNKKVGTTSKYGSTNVPAPETRDAGDIVSDNELPAGVDMPAMNSESSSELANVNVGIKNFDQINITMAELTGIPATDSAIVALYNDIAIQLPSDNNVKNFLPSMQVAITKLATEYCDRLIEVGTKRATIWPAVNFSQTPSQTLTATNKSNIINQTVSYFLGPISDTESTKIKAELSTLFDELLVGESLTVNTTTRKVMKGMCTSVLGSAYITLM